MSRLDNRAVLVCVLLSAASPTAVPGYADLRMSGTTGGMYTASQITVPSDLPEILKQYTKAAIKTNPSDLVLWSYQYAPRL
jgi:hypothetical protein